MATTKIFLIVDDDGDDRDLFCEALQAVSPESACRSATNGRGALKVLENWETGMPDLIFLDLNMPVMNGWQLLSILKTAEAYKDIPVIIYSTSSYPEDVEKARRSGALCFFNKPASFQELKHILAFVVEHLDAGSLPQLVHRSPLFLTCSA